MYVCLLLFTSPNQVFLTRYLPIVFIDKGCLNEKGTPDYEEERLNLVYFEKLKKNVFPGHLRKISLQKKRKE